MQIAVTYIPSTMKAEYGFVTKDGRKVLHWFTFGVDPLDEDFPQPHLDPPEQNDLNEEEMTHEKQPF